MHVSRFQGLLRFSLLTSMYLFFTSCQSASKALGKRPPNIVFILTDDQGWGDLSINGNANLSTPNIDNLAKNGSRFDRFYVSPVCSPTRAKILTGRYNPRGGVYSTSAGGERLDLDETTIADVFKEAGYATGAFGKWHNGMQYPYHPNGRGFDEFYGFCSGHWGNYFSPMLERNGKIIRGNGFVIDDFTEQAMNFIEKNKERPFFVYLPYNTPHSPMQVLDRWWNKFKNKKLELRHHAPHKEKIQHTKAALAMCENIDWNVGRLVDRLESLDLIENTIIVYLSDNGPNGWRWNDGMKGRKGSTDEGGVRSPLFIQWKGKIQGGLKIPQIGSAIDFLPTLADLADIEYETNKPIDGKSLKPLLLGNSEEWEDSYIFNFWRNRLSVRSQKFRLGNEDKLFDMVSDPGQKVDVSEQFQEIKKEMLAAKADYLQNVVSELPERDERTFPVGHMNFKNTQIPARDGIAHGNIKRSNRYPNCSFFTNWVDVNDKITWEVEVLEEGEFGAIIYYACSEENVGSTIELSFGASSVQHTIFDEHDPSLFGMAEDRDPRIESYVKDFKPFSIGTIHLEKGVGTLALKAKEVVGEEAMDFRLLMLNRKE